MGLDMYLYNGNDEVGYWRKANQIHNWFVKNVQNGVDDCGTYPVPREKVVELLGLVEHVLDHELDDFNHVTAYSTLPTTAGFFFGSTDYGRWYYDDLENTKKILTGILASERMKDSWDLKYFASW